eukprot:8305953-Alexandrium_andersonii.AAC.1
MSASLVGSEMCIRDREGPVRDPRGPPSEDSDRQVFCAVDGPYVTEAVSYTHLTLPTICSV